MINQAAIRALGLELADDYPLLTGGDASPFRHETFNLWCYDPDTNIGLCTQFVSEDRFSTFRATVMVFRDGAIHHGIFRGAGTRKHGPGAGNAFATNLKPFQLWHYNFAGVLPDAKQAPDARETIIVAYDLDIEIVSEPVESGSQGDRGLNPSSGSVPRIAMRYEQLCYAKGAVRIGDMAVQVNALGMRSHRRNSASIYASGAVGHSWITGLFEDGRGFHLIARRIGVSAEVGFGHASWFDGKQHWPARVLTFPHYSGEAGEESDEIVLLVEGEEKTIKSRGIAPLLSDIALDHAVPESAPVRLSRAPGRFQFDGVRGGGILERSLRADFATGGYYRGGAQCAGLRCRDGGVRDARSRIY